MFYIWCCICIKALNCMIVKSSWYILNIGDSNDIWSKNTIFFLVQSSFNQLKTTFQIITTFFNKFTKNAPWLLHLRLRVYFCWKACKLPKNNECTADSFISNLNVVLQNEIQTEPINYNDINDNMSKNSDDDPMDSTDCIGYVKTIDYTDATDATENDENINYDGQGIFYWK